MSERLNLQKTQQDSSQLHKMKKAVPAPGIGAVPKAAQHQEKKRKKFSLLSFLARKTVEEHQDLKSLDITGMALPKQDTKQTERSATAQIPRMERVTQSTQTSYLTDVPPGFKYEHQGNNNCFACSGSAIFNWFTRNEGLSDEERLTQKKVRSFVPNFLSDMELALTTGQEGAEGQKDIDDIELFAGKHKDQFGNFFAVSDVLFDWKERGGLERKDIAVHSMIFQLRDAEDNKRFNMIQMMKSKMHHILGQDQMISVCRKGHYLTVVGLDGDNVTFLNSSDLEPIVPQTCDIDTFLSAGTGVYDTTEMHWISKLTPESKDDLLDEFGNMGYEPDKQEITRRGGDPIQEDVAHRAGIVIKKEKDELRGEFGDLAGDIAELIALPRMAFAVDKDRDKKAELDYDAPRKLERDQMDQAIEAALEEDRRKAEQAKKAKKDSGVKPKEKEKPKEEKEKPKEEEEKPKEEKEKPKEEKSKTEKKAPESIDTIYAAERMAVMGSLTAIKENAEKLFKEREKKQKKGSHIVRPSYKEVYAFDKGYTIDEKKTPEERSKSAKSRFSELHGKVKRKDELLKAVGADKTRRQAQAVKLSKGYEALLNIENMEELAAFFTEDTGYNDTLVMLFSGKYLKMDAQKKEQAAEMNPKVKAEAMESALDLMTDQILTISTNGIDFSSDEKLIKSAAYLENMTVMLSTYQRYLGNAGGYMDRMRTKEGGQQRYLRLKSQLEKVTAVTEYYAARKAVITDEFYLLHYDRELGIIIRGVNDQPEEHPKEDLKEQQEAKQKALSAKLLKSRTAAEKLSKTFGEQASGERLVKRDDSVETWDQKGSRLSVSALERCKGTKRLEDMAIFYSDLMRLDSGSHSTEYEMMMNRYSALFTYMQKQAQDSEDKKLGSEEILNLRFLHERAIEGIKVYLDGKNRDHKNKIYKERYNVAADMMSLLNDDHQRLLEIPFDPKCSLAEALDPNKTFDGEIPDARYILEDELGMKMERVTKEDEAGLGLENEADKAVADYLFGSSETTELKAPPTLESMQLISERMAARILSLNKQHLSYKLGKTADDPQKKAIWERVEKMKAAVLAAQTAGKQGQLQIVRQNTFKEFVRDNENPMWHSPLAEQKLECGRTADNFDELFKNVFGEDFMENRIDDTAKSRGIKSIGDVFYVDGKRLSEGWAKKINKLNESLNDKAAAEKACLMSLIRENKHAIVVATWQKNAEGFYEPALTDLNIVLAGEKSKTIDKSRRDRPSRFADIRKDMEKRRKAAREEAIEEHRVAENEALKKANAHFADAANVFMAEKEKGRSDEFIAVKRALDYMYRTKVQKKDSEETESLIDMLARGSYTWTAENYRRFTELSEALSHYCAGHMMPDTVVGAARRDAAFVLMRTMRKVVRNDPVTGYNGLPPLGKVGRREAGFASVNVFRMVSAYRAYAARVGEDLIASPDEKIRRKWDMLKSVERDILIFMEQRRANPDALTVDEKFLLEEYHRIRAQILLRDKLKDREGFEEVFKNERTGYIREESRKSMLSQKQGRQAEEEKKKAEHGVDGLSPKQLNEMRRIDHWVLRNIRNGGYMTLGYNTVDRTDIADRLMSLSFRQRLYVYYIVENPRARKAPRMSDAMNSQMDYVPDLDNFKNKIIPTKAKFYTRFSGGYIYWHKVTEAMSIIDANEDMLDIIDKVSREEEKEADTADKTLAKEEQEADPLEQMLRKLYKAEQLIKSCGEGKISEDKFSEILANTKTELQKYLDEFDVVTKRLAEQEIPFAGKKTGGAQTKGQTFQLYSTELSTAATFGKISKNLGEMINTVGSIKIGTGSAKVENAVGLLGDLFGIVFTGYKLYKGWGSMNEADRIYGVSNALVKIAKLGKSATNYAKLLGASSQFVKVMNGVGVTGAFAAVDTVMAVGMTVTGEVRRSDRSLAVDMAVKSQKRDQYESLQTGVKKEDRYRDGLVRLDHIITKRDRVENGGAYAAAGVSIATTAIMAAGLSAPVTGGLSALLLAGGFAVSTFVKAFKGNSAKEMRREVVGSAIDVDSMIEEAMRDWRREHDDEGMSDKQKERLRVQILYRVAADLGYYSPSQMAHEVAKKYAQYLIEGAKEEGGNSSFCINMITGLGLPFDMDFDTREVKKPQASDIIKKLVA